MFPEVDLDEELINKPNELKDIIDAKNNLDLMLNKFKKKRVWNVYVESQVNHLLNKIIKIINVLSFLAKDLYFSSYYDKKLIIIYWYT